MADNNNMVTQLREAAAGLRKQAAEQKYAHTIKCAQVLAGAKGLISLASVMDKMAQQPAAPAQAPAQAPATAGKAPVAPTGQTAAAPAPPPQAKQPRPTVLPNMVAKDPTTGTPVKQAPPVPVGGDAAGLAAIDREAAAAKARGETVRSADAGTTGNQADPILAQQNAERAAKARGQVYGDQVVQEAQNTFELPGPGGKFFPVDEKTYYQYMDKQDRPIKGMVFDPKKKVPTPAPTVAETNAPPIDLNAGDATGGSLF